MRIVFNFKTLVQSPRFHLPRFALTNAVGDRRSQVLTFACALAYEANVALEYPPELFCLPGSGKATRWCPSSLAKLIYNLNHYGLWLIYLYTYMVYTPSYNWGGTTLQEIFVGRGELNQY